MRYSIQTIRTPRPHMRGNVLPWLLASIIIVGGLVALLVLNPFQPKAGGGELIVYCAAGVHPPIEEITKQFEEEVGVKVRFMHGNSGSLQVQIREAHKGDLYIPADITFVEQLRREGKALEAISIAKFTLVLAVQKGNPKKITTLNDLLKEEINFGVATDPAAVGKRTKKILTGTGDWDRIRDGAKVRKTTVREVAQDVAEGFTDAGFVWDATARQEGLDIVAIAELDTPKAVSNVTAGVLTISKRPADALRFARYLAAPERGQKAFAKHHYDTVDGDPWALSPRIKLFAGGLNSVGCKEIVEAFAQREGVQIDRIYTGCGTLVGMMKGGEHPDMYFACDVSYANDVADLFKPFETVSQTRVVLLVPTGSDKVQSVADLAKPGLRIGRCDPKLSALGGLTEKLLKSMGVFDAMQANGTTAVTAGTADFLVAQLTESGKLDAAIVYAANCNYIGDKARMIEIDHPLAIAVQPISTSKETKYPDLMHRLTEAITSEQAKQQFEKVGFKWRWHQSEQEGP